MAIAGPSRTRLADYDLSDGSDSLEEDSQLPRGTRAPNGAVGKRKRASALGSTLEEVFSKQDPEEKRKLGAEYRSLQQEAEDMKSNLANVTAAQITNAIRRQSELFAKVRDTGIARLDAKLISTNTDTALSLARKMRIEGNALDVDDFLLRVKRRLGLDRIALEDEDQPDEEDELEDSQGDRPARRRTAVRQGPLGDWEKLGWAAAKMSRRVPGIDFMYGPLKVEHHGRAVMQRNRKKDLAPETRPQEIRHKEGETAAKDDTVSIVAAVQRLLRAQDTAGTGLNFFEFVVNPESFGQSVENVFFVSFLINSGHAGIEVESDGAIVLRREDPQVSEMGDEITKNQAVIEFDMETWQEAIRTFDIKESIIPHRHYVDAAPLAADQWYS